MTSYGQAHRMNGAAAQSALFVVSIIIILALIFHADEVVRMLPA